jgi:membrane-associated phospholipid phosphatase
MSRARREPSSRKGLAPCVIALMAVVLGGERVARAEETSQDIELRHDLRIDVPVIVGLAGGLIAYTAVGRDNLLPPGCRWCDGTRPSMNAVDDFFRTALVRRDTAPAGQLSHVVSYVSGPIIITTLLAAAEWDEAKTKNFLVDGVIVSEATLTAVAVSEAIKAFTLRERPNIHVLVDEDHHATESAKSGANHSFPSGHTLAIMALTASAGTVAAMRHYRAAPVIWITGTMLALAAGYLRIAADQHYFTDTLAGAALGLGIGAGMPLLFHGPRSIPALVTADGRTLSLTIGF